MLQVTKSERGKAHGDGKAVSESTASVPGGSVSQDMHSSFSRVHLLRMTRMDSESRIHLTSALSGSAGGERAHMESTKSGGKTCERKPSGRLARLLRMPNAMPDVRRGICAIWIGKRWNTRC